jgi:hypothetical protein
VSHVGRVFVEACSESHLTYYGQESASKQGSPTFPNTKVLSSINKAIARSITTPFCTIAKYNQSTILYKCFNAHKLPASAHFWISVQIYKLLDEIQI